MTDQKYKLVPTEPKAEMLEAAGTIDGYEGAAPDKDHVAWYKAAIASAPEPVSQGYYGPIDTPERAIYEKCAAMDNQDVPLEEWPNGIIEALSAAGYAIVTAKSAPEPVCRWTKRGTRPWLYAHDGQHFYDGLQPDPYNYCPHCGRKVEVVEDE